MKPFYVLFEEEVKKEREKFCPYPNSALATKVAEHFQTFISPLFSFPKEKLKTKTKSIFKRILSFLKNVSSSLSSCPLNEGEGRERWGEVMYYVGLAQNETLTVKDASFLHELLHIFIATLKMKEEMHENKRKIFTKIALQWAYYLETHWIDPCNLFIGSSPSSALSLILSPLAESPPPWLTNPPRYPEIERARAEGGGRSPKRKRRHDSPPRSPPPSTPSPPLLPSFSSIPDSSRSFAGGLSVEAVSSSPPLTKNTTSPKTSPRVEKKGENGDRTVNMLKQASSPLLIFTPREGRKEGEEVREQGREEREPSEGMDALSFLLTGKKVEAEGEEQNQNQHRIHISSSYPPSFLSSIPPGFGGGIEGGEGWWARWLSYLRSGNVEVVLEQMQALAKSQCIVQSGELVCVDTQKLLEACGKKFNITKMDIHKDNSLVFCRLAGSMTNQSKVAEVFIDPMEVVSVSVPACSVMGLDRKLLTEAMLTDTTGRLICQDRLFGYYSHVISHLESFVKSHLNSQKISWEFSEVKDLGIAFESKNLLTALMKDKKTLFSLCGNFLKDLSDISIEWLQSCLLFPFCVVSLRPLLRGIESFVSRLHSLIKQELQMYHGQVISQVNALEDKTRSILSGETKRDYCDRWLLYIRKKSHEFMENKGINFSALPEDYTNQCPEDLKLVKKNYELAKKCLEGDKATEEFILQTTKEVYEILLSPFLSEVKVVLEMSPKILEKMSKKQAPTIMGAITGEGVDGEGGEEGLEEDLRGLKEDYLYLKKMQKMDDEIIEKRKNANQERKGLEMSDVVPVAGLIMAQFHICECEHSTALETWGGEEQELGGAIDKQESTPTVGFIQPTKSWLRTQRAPSTSPSAPLASRVSLGKDRRRREGRSEEEEEQGEDRDEEVREFIPRRKRNRGTIGEMMHCALVQRKGTRGGEVGLVRKSMYPEKKEEEKGDEAMWMGARGFLQNWEDDSSFSGDSKSLSTLTSPTLSSPSSTSPNTPSTSSSPSLPPSPSSTSPTSTPPLSPNISRSPSSRTPNFSPPSASSHSLNRSMSPLPLRSNFGGFSPARSPRPSPHPLSQTVGEEPTPFGVRSSSHRVLRISTDTSSFFDVPVGEEEEKKAFVVGKAHQPRQGDFLAGKKREEKK